MKALVGVLNKEKTIVVALSGIVKTDELFAAVDKTLTNQPRSVVRAGPVLVICTVITLPRYLVTTCDLLLITATAGGASVLAPILSDITRARAPHRNCLLVLL